MQFLFKNLKTFDRYLTSMTIIFYEFRWNSFKSDRKSFLSWILEDIYIGPKTKLVSIIDTHNCYWGQHVGVRFQDKNRSTKLSVWRKRNIFESKEVSLSLKISNYFFSLLWVRLYQNQHSNILWINIMAKTITQKMKNSKQ